MAAPRADRAVATRRAFGSELADVVGVMVVFPFVVEVSTRWKQPAGKAAGSPEGNGQHGILERAAPLIPPRGRLKERGKLTAAPKAEAPTRPDNGDNCVEAHRLL